MNDTGTWLLLSLIFTAVVFAAMFVAFLTL